MQAGLCQGLAARLPDDETQECFKVKVRRRVE